MPRIVLNSRISSDVLSKTISSVLTKIDQPVLESSDVNFNSMNISSTTNSISTLTGALTINGGMGITKDIYYGGTLQNMSDKRLKDVISPINNVLDKIKKISPIVYKRNDIKDSSLELGFIAQEVYEQFPELVKIDEKGFYSMDYSRMTAVLFQCIKELNNK